MNKLPFVWELNYKGIVSHGVGLYHFIENKYQKDIARFLKDKKSLLVEKTFIGEYFPLPFPLDPAIQNFAYEKMKLKVIPLETKQENMRAGLVYKNKPSNKHTVQAIKNAYLNGDEQKLRKLVEKGVEKNFSKKDISQIESRNRLLARRSLEHLIENPQMVAVGVFHFTAYQPTLIDLYKEKGIKVERVQ